MLNKKRFRKEDEKGFTVVELIIAVVILGIILYAAFQLTFSNYFLLDEESIKATLNQEASDAIEKIVKDMRKSDDANIKLYDAAVPIDSTPPGNAITSADVDTGLLVVNNGADAYCYRLDSSNSLVKFKLSDSTTGTVPADTSKVQTIVTAKANYKQVNNFSVRILRNYPSALSHDDSKDNYRKYFVSLQLEEGPGDKKVVVNQSTTLIKNKIPN
ncbi:MAG: PilW family protein [Ignavibacteriales bacterium]